MAVEPYKDKQRFRYFMRICVHMPCGLMYACIVAKSVSVIGNCRIRIYAPITAVMGYVSLGLHVDSTIL